MRIEHNIKIIYITREPQRERDKEINPNYFYIIGKDLLLNLTPEEIRLSSFISLGLSRRL